MPYFVNVAEMVKRANYLLTFCVCGHHRIRHHGRSAAGHCWNAVCECSRFRRVRTGVRLTKEAANANRN